MRPRLVPIGLRSVRGRPWRESATAAGKKRVPGIPRGGPGENDRRARAISKERIDHAFNADSGYASDAIDRGSGPGLGLRPRPARPACSRGSAPPPPPPGVPRHLLRCRVQQAPAAAPDDLSSDPISKVTAARLSFSPVRCPSGAAGAISARPRHSMLRSPRRRPYTGPNGNVEIQIGTRAFVRAALRHADRPRQPGPGLHPVPRHERPGGTRPAPALAELTLELERPNAAFTVDHSGCYRLEVDQDSSRLGVYRGGSATVTPAGGPPPRRRQPAGGPQSEASPRAVALGAAPPTHRLGQLELQGSGEREPAVRARARRAGGLPSRIARSVRTLAHGGNVRFHISPGRCRAGWDPYSPAGGSGIPGFGWTWLDAVPIRMSALSLRPLGLRRQLLGIGARPRRGATGLRSRLVVFLGGPTVALAAAVLGDRPDRGEPVLPSSGRLGFAGVPSSGGRTGPRVVDNVVIIRTDRARDQRHGVQTCA